MDEKTFKQEYLAQWIDYSGLIYYAFGDHNITSKEDLLTRDTLLHIGIDFNLDPGCAVIAVKTQFGLHVIDEIEIFGTNTQEMCEEIQRRYGHRRVIVYPDASGAQRRTSALGGITDHIILSNSGFQLKVGSINPAVKDRIASVNSVMKHDNCRLTFDPKCVKIIKGLQKHVYKEGTRSPEKNSGLDHFNDALGYMVNHLFPMNIKPITNHMRSIGQKARRTL